MIVNPDSYAPGGSVYNTLTERYGRDAADRAATIAATGDGDALNRLLSDLKRDNTQADFDNRGTASVFFDQVTTDPLAAPLESANRQLGLAVWNVVKNPFVLIVVVVLIAWRLGLLKTLLPKARF